MTFNAHMLCSASSKGVGMRPVLTFPLLQLVRPSRSFSSFSYRTWNDYRSTHPEGAHQKFLQRNGLQDGWFTWSHRCHSSIAFLKTHQRNSPEDLRIHNRSILGCFNPIRNAGHSKWQNIRHIKAAKDGEKAAVANRIARQIKIAVREGGGADPKFNIQLARVLEQAKKADIPNSTTDNVLKKIIKSGNSGSTYFFEAKGPGNFMMIIEIFSDNHRRTKIGINVAFKKFGGMLSDKIASHFFDYKGLVVVTPGGNLPNLDSAEEAAILCEAEEVEETADEDGSTVFHFITDPKMVHSVQQSLMEQYPDVAVEAASFRYIPTLYTTLTDAQLEVAGKLVDALEALDEVSRVYTNIQVEQ